MNSISPSSTSFGLERAEVLGAIRAARAEHWLARTPLGFMLSDYRDAVAVLRDRRFHSALSLLPQMAGIEADGFMENRRPSILGMEGAEHARLRRLVAPAFTPAATDRLRPFMREVVSGLVDEVAEQGRCEFVADICEPYPIPIICALLGAPKEDWKLFSQWATDIFRLFNQDLATDLPAIERASGELEAYVNEMIEERRTRASHGQPGDDLLSTLIAIEEEGDRLSERRVGDVDRGRPDGRDRHHPEPARLQRGPPGRAPRAVGAVGGPARAGPPGGGGVDALPGGGAGDHPGGLRGHRVPRRPLPGRDARVGRPGLGQHGRRGLRRPRDLRHQRRARRPADDLRVGHPLLHGGGPGPGRAAGGAAPAGPADARPGRATDRWNGSRPPSASGDRPGSPCASAPSV